MRGKWFLGSLRYEAPVIVCFVCILALLLLPTGFEDALNYQEAEWCTFRKARI